MSAADIGPRVYSHKIDVVCAETTVKSDITSKQTIEAVSAYLMEKMQYDFTALISEGLGYSVVDSEFNISALVKLLKTTGGTVDHKAMQDKALTLLSNAQYVLFLHSSVLM